MILTINCLDRQPLLDALPVCGSENCVVLLMDLMKDNELEVEQALSFLTTIALIPHPSPQIINSINVGISGCCGMNHDLNLKFLHMQYK